jgi:hypothetical protein
MASATRVTYDALIAFYLEVSTILADGPRASSASRHQLEISAIWAALSPESGPMREPECAGQTELTPEQAELIEKLNCLEFETSKLNRAYQLWSSYVEQGTVPDWMAAAITITHHSLMTFCLEVSSILADGPHVFAARRLARLLAAPSPEFLPLLPAPQPDWSQPEMPAVIPSHSTNGSSHSTNGFSHSTNGFSHSTNGFSPSTNGFSHSTNGAISEQHILHQDQQELGPQEDSEADVPQAFPAKLLGELKAVAYSTSGMWEEENTSAEPSSDSLSITEPDWPVPETSAAFPPPSAGHALWEQTAIQQDQLEEDAGEEISGIYEEEPTTAELSPKLLPLLPTAQQDWSDPEMPTAISPSIGNAISEQRALLQAQHEDEEGIEPATIQNLGTLAANWLQGSSTGILFFVPPGTLGKIVRATFVAILIIAAGTFGIYVVNARRAASTPPELPVQNSAAQPAAGGIAIPSAEKAAFKFEPDPVAAPLGRSFVLNAMLSHGSDIASVAVQIDYDANLLRFIGVSQGGVLVKNGQQLVIVQHDDPAAGVLKISAEQTPGNPSISGDGPVFALSFQARKRGNATVSIIPSARDSLGRRIEMAGSQVSVRVN